MTGGVVDLFSGFFWVVAAVAITVLTPLSHLGARQAALFAVNAGFLWLLIGYRALGVLGGVLLLAGLLRVIEAAKARAGLLVAALAISLALLIAHKLPDSSAGLGAVHPVLLAIGYSYVFLRIVDVSRAVSDGQHPAPSPLPLFNYLVPFHMLAAGPIQSYQDFTTEQAVPAPPRFQDVLGGVERIVFGMFKKFVVAFTVERLFLTQFTVGGWYRIVEMHLYFLWFYLDFSAYSDVAVGVGKLIGVRTPENFDRPYLARNMIEFWERWHISLSQWIRRNLFIPVQLVLLRRTEGSHALLVATASLGLSFLLCGLWHGASLPFFLWGAMHGVGVMAANLYRELLKKRLGRQGVRAYLENRWIRVAATVLTVEYVSLSLMIVGWHWQS